MFDVMDTQMTSSLHFLITLYNHQAPIRIGFVPVAKEGDEVGALLVQVFYKLVDEKDGAEAVTMLTQVG